MTKQSFLDTLEKKQHLLIHNKILDQTVSVNRAKLPPIVKTVLLCGRQNIPLSGHRDDSSHYGSVDCANSHSSCVVS